MASPPPEGTEPEAPVPVKTEDAGLPTRKIFDFTIVNAGNAAVSLEALHSLPAGSLVAVGMVPSSDGQQADGEERSQPCRTHPITDWIIHYGDNPGVYISTEKAWYRLERPAAAYAPHYASLQRKVDFCLRGARCIAENPKIGLHGAIGGLLQPSPRLEGTSATLYSAEDLTQETPFVVPQLLTWLERLNFSPPPPLLVELKTVADRVLMQRMAEAEQQQAAQQAGAGGQAGRGRGRGAPAQAGPKRRRSGNDEEDEYEEEDNKLAKGRGGRGAGGPARGGGRGVGGMYGGAAAHRGASAAAGAPGAGPGFEYDGYVGDEDPDLAEYDGAGANREEEGEGEDGASESTEEGEEYAGLSAEERLELRKQRRPGRIERRRAALQARMTAADEARGEPPEAVSEWRVDPDMVPDVLAVWEMCMTFSFMLQLPPVPIRALEAAIMPGPLPLRNPDGSPKLTEPIKKEPAAPAEGADGAVAAEAAEGAGAEAAEGAGAEAAEGATAEAAKVAEGVEPAAKEPVAAVEPEAPRGIVYDVSTMLDQDYVPSAALLRDLHAGLLRLVDGHAPRKQELPQEAKLMADEAKTENWVERTTAAIHAAAVEVVGQDAKVAAESLKTREYVLLTPRAKLAILRGLIDLALASEVLREHINARSDMFAVPLRSLAGAGINLSAGEDGVARRHVEACVKPAEPAGPREAEDPDFWVRWMDSCKLGLRKPIGSDFRGRRYWALGANAGAWRVYVEAGEKTPWGWYEGEKLAQLLEWLRRGDIAREKPLIRLLNSVQLPRPVHEAGEVKEEELAHAAIPWSPADLEARRANGYRHLVAPLLRGNLNQLPHQPGTPRVPLLVEDRICNALEALAGEVDFWSQEAGWAGRLGELLDLLRYNYKAAQQILAGAQRDADGEPMLNEQAAAIARFSGAPVVGAAEEMLFQMGAMREPWASQLRDAWLNSLRNPSYGTREVALHVLALQQFVATSDAPNVLTRAGFLRRVNEARCPLYFPGPNETVVVLRTGIFHHIEKMWNFARANNDMPMLTELVALRDRCKQLLCAQRYRVACLAYRTYPLQKPAGGEAAAPDAAQPPAQPDGAAADPADPAAPPPVVHHQSRPPCMWMLLTPLRAPLPHFEQATSELVLPIYIDNTLPNYVIRTDVMDRARQRDWQPGDRCRMYVGGKQGAKVSGSWFKGRILAVAAAPAPDQQDFDPWESITVEWDKAADGQAVRVGRTVCAWDIEMDPEAERRLAEERKRAEAAAAEVAARAARSNAAAVAAAAAAAKAERLAAKVVEPPPEEDDDEYVPSEPSDDDSDISDDSEDSSERPRGRGKPKKPIGRGRGGRPMQHPQQHQQRGQAPGNMSQAQAQAFLQQRQVALFQQQQQQQRLVGMAQALGPGGPAILQQLQTQLAALPTAQQIPALQQFVARGGQHAPLGQQLLVMVQAQQQLQAQQAQAQLLQQQQQQQQAAQQARQQQQEQQQLLLQQQQQQARQQQLLQQQQQAALQAQQQQAAAAAMAEEDNGRPVAPDLNSPPLRSAAGSPRRAVAYNLLQIMPQREAFNCLVVNWYRLRSVNRYRLPRLNNKDVDLRQLFLDVALRGGYDAVTVGNKWPEVCVQQNIHPNAPASAQQPNLPSAAGLRAHYERCLLDFEDYVNAGQFEADVANGRLPPLDRLVDVAGAPAPAAKRTEAAAGAQYAQQQQAGYGGANDARAQQLLLLQQQQQAAAAAGNGGAMGYGQGGYGGGGGGGGNATNANDAALWAQLARQQGGQQGRPGYG